MKTKRRLATQTESNLTQEIAEMGKLVTLVEGTAEVEEMAIEVSANPVLAELVREIFNYVKKPMKPHQLEDQETQLLLTISQLLATQRRVLTGRTDAKLRRTIDRSLGLEDADAKLNRRRTIPAA